MDRPHILEIVALLFVPVSLFSQTLGHSQAEKFVRALLGNEKSLASWFDKSSLETSHRLGIRYDGVENKNLISYDVEDTLKRLVRDEHLAYPVSVDTLGGEFARLVLTIGGFNVTKVFYFKDDRCISPFAYFARNWTVINSKHFRFFISDTTLFNSYCIHRLEAYLSRMAEVLGMDKRDMKTLEKKKIYYYMCRDESEIERLTGYASRGMYNLAYDVVVTTFNTHYHELTHLLINYRLRRLPLYTNPFLQEGFAVAYGGRGGLDPAVLLNVGGFLYRSQFVGVPQLLNKEEFEKMDPSMTYPAAGLYNKCLVETLGIKRYLQLYRAHSGTAGESGVTQIEPSELPSDSAWESYLRQALARSPVVLDGNSNNARVIFQDSTCTISEDSLEYHFLLSDFILIPGSEYFPNYVSKTFQEFFPGRKYEGEEYLVRATGDEISVYNLFTNNLIASYVAPFSIPPETVPQIGGRYSFSVRKSLFDEHIAPGR